MIGVPLTRSRLQPRMPIKAVYFDGVEDYVETANSISLNENITLEALFMPSVIPQSHDYPMLMSNKINTGSGFIFRIDSMDPPNLCLIIWKDYVSPGSACTILDGIRWYHGIGIVDNDSVKLYVDGTFRKATTLSDVAPTVNDIVRIGWRQLSMDFFEGYIAFVRIYNRALTEDEIEWNYLHPKDPVRDGLMLWLDAEDYDGATWPDRSGYKHEVEAHIT